MRRVYGARQRMLHERQCLLNGLSQMFSDEAKPMDADAFLWTGVVNPSDVVGRTKKRKDTPQDHMVNILAAQIHREGRFNLESLMETWEKLPKPWEDKAEEGGERQTEDDGEQQ